MKYRIMCQGEDGMLFCVENNIPNAQLNEQFEKAEDNYPEGKLWAEEEGDAYREAIASYNEEQEYNDYY